MNEAGSGSASGALIEAQSEQPIRTRGPLKGVTVLLPVWGYRFVSQFLEFCLPTLLAPGNIPAIAAAVPCKFVVLSSEADAPMIRVHPAWATLNRVCDTEIRSADDLITDGNHTATITLAFARAVRESGGAMLDTCFMFLMSDYLVADGSLKAALDAVQDGASGVVAGNYQIVAEDAIPLLRRKTDDATPIELKPREFMRWSLLHLHPATVANIVNFGLSHNAHINRLFWRVDEDTLIGRFYLMHPIAIRPEVTDFVVGASIDYSFIPEMCPSGRVAALADSDKYLVVEMQPRAHENKHLAPGPIEVEKLASSLAEWTTAEHRRNVEQTIVYHAADIPTALPQFVTDADTFVARVRKLLPVQAQPHRNHHYWIGSIAVSRAKTRRPLGKADWEFLLGEAMPGGGLAGFVWRARFKLLGDLPDATRIHPRWPDYALPLKRLRQLSASGRVLLLSPRPAAYVRWLTRTANEFQTLECAQLLEMQRALYMPLLASFDVCLMMLSEDELEQLDGLVARAAPLLQPGGQIMIVIINNRMLDEAADFGKSFAGHACRLLSTSAWLTEVNYVPASRLRWAVSRLIRKIARRGSASAWRAPIVVPLLGIAGPLIVANFLCNMNVRPTKVPPRGVCSSLFLILRRYQGGPLPLPVFRLSDTTHLGARQRLRFERTRTTGGRTTTLHEPKNEMWRDDPEYLAARFALYRFVGGLLQYRHDVAQYGADIFGIPMILRKVKKIAVYDADTMAIYNASHKFGEEAPVTFCNHDIIASPLPRRHDSIYSIDILNYVSRGDQDPFCRNLALSIAREYDPVIIGVSCSSEMQTNLNQRHSLSAAAVPARVATLSPLSSDGTEEISQEFNIRSAEELRALLTRHFHEVFIFSIIDGVVRSGLVSPADYIFALCCSPKR
jgi:hypothetical protein